MQPFELSSQGGPINLLVAGGKGLRMAEDSFSLRLHFSGGDADAHMLDAYDGSTSLHGFAQALQIATWSCPIKTGQDQISV